MLSRDMTTTLRSRFAQFPMVFVAGPRQSGKTTLCKAAFGDMTYVNLESLDMREFATADPLAFLDQVGSPVILDEIQRVPDLFSYLQVRVDEVGTNGQFVLTGSEQIGLNRAIDQSLAGRVSMLRLLPLSLAELNRNALSNTLNEHLFLGGYPRIYDQMLSPSVVYDDYYHTHVEKDVMLAGGIGDLRQFEIFTQLCAGNVGGLLNLNRVGRDVGISQTTAKRWLSILERHFIAFTLKPYFANTRKRLVKSPKLYFYDVGLACFLLGIRREDQLVTHRQRGDLFENLVIVEALKHSFNRGSRPLLSFFRDSNGVEGDLLIQNGSEHTLVEIKSSETLRQSFFKNIENIASVVPSVKERALVYGGSSSQVRSAAKVVPFLQFDEFLNKLV